MLFPLYKVPENSRKKGHFRQTSAKNQIFVRNGAINDSIPVRTSPAQP